MTSTLPVHIAIALNEVGVKEQPLGSNRGERVDLYTGGRAEPYCAHFVAWCFREAGMAIPGDVIPMPKRANPLASVAHMERVFFEHGWLMKEPLPGDVIFYKNRGQSDPGRGRHVGLVLGVDKGYIETVEANWSDSVVKRRLPRSDPRIANYGRRPRIG